MICELTPVHITFLADSIVAFTMHTAFEEKECVKMTFTMGKKYAHHSYVGDQKNHMIQNNTYAIEFKIHPEFNSILLFTVNRVDVRHIETFALIHSSTFLSAIFKEHDDYDCEDVELTMISPDKVVYWFNSSSSPTCDHVFQFDFKTYCSVEYRGECLAVRNVYALQGGKRMVITSTINNHLEIWDVELGRRICILIGHMETIRRVKQLSDGRLLTLCASGVLKIWNLSDFPPSCESEATFDDEVYDFIEIGSYLDKKTWFLVTTPYKKTNVATVFNLHTTKKHGILYTIAGLSLRSLSPICGGRFVAARARRSERKNVVIVIWDMKTLTHKCTIQHPVGDISNPSPNIFQLGDGRLASHIPGQRHFKVWGRDPYAMQRTKQRAKKAKRKATRKAKQKAALK